MFIICRFNLGGCLVAQVLVQPGGVPPMGPVHRGELDFGQGSPRGLGVDQLGLIQPVDGLGQSIIVRVTYGSNAEALNSSE